MESTINNSDSGRTLSMRKGRLKNSRGSLSLSWPNALLQKHVAPFFSLKQTRATKGSTAQLLLFFIKVVALEAARRLSESRCPFLWRGIQGIGRLHCPPLRLLQKWNPLRQFVKAFTKPMLFLSISTIFVSYQKEQKIDGDKNTNEDTDSNSRAIGPSAISERDHVGIPKSVNQGHWLQRLKEELEKRSIVLPDRITDYELERFYFSARGNFSQLMSSVEKTILWRETYHFFPLQQLESWSHLVFWHGWDIQLRPCLIIRLGLACSCLRPDERPRFAQAVVSQVEYGVLHFLYSGDSRITVIIDCEKTFAFGFPMQMVKSCIVVVQQHFPACLASLFVMNLPPVMRIITKAFIQVLTPSTRKKVHIEGDLRLSRLSEYFECIPSFLGGDCTCAHCNKAYVHDDRDPIATSKELVHGESDGEEEQGNLSENYPSPRGSCDRILRIIIIAFLLLWIVVAFRAGFENPDPQLSLTVSPSTYVL